MPGKETLVITKESHLHEAVLDYTIVAGAIKMKRNEEQEYK